MRSAEEVAREIAHPILHHSFSSADAIRERIAGFIRERDAEVARLHEDCCIHLMKRHEVLAEVERLRSGITEVIEDCLSQPGADHDFDHDPKGVVADVLTALLNPTEGGSDA